MLPDFVRNPILWMIIGLLLIGGGIYVLFFSEPPVTETHLHADFALYINDQRWNFAQEKYMTDQNGQTLSTFVHLHDLDGNIIHVHAPGITLGDFFESLGMKLSPTCFVTDENTVTSRYCTTDSETTLHVFVNGTEIQDGSHYVMKDLDRILVAVFTYGTESPAAIQAQLASVTNNACIQSGKCPERGEPSDESTCTTAGGCQVGHIAT